jgi:hypothetical protein
MANEDDELNAVIQQALQSVDDDPEHDLRLGLRQAIWQAFGPRRESPGQLRRVTLAVLAIRHVLPLWDAAFADPTFPRRLLTSAEQASQQGTDREQLLQQLNAAWERADELAMESGSAAAAVGYGAVQALTVALQDEHFDPDAVDLSAVDSPDIQENDASFFAAAAYADGPRWREQSSRERRREFWRWWLTQAVPEAAKLT